MYESLEVINFRCFDHLKISSMARLNLIAGNNNVGKTALLEAFFLHLGRHNPNLTVSLNVFRGIEQFDLNAEEIWGWLFSNKNVTKQIEITGIRKNKQRQRLFIKLSNPLRSSVITLVKPSDEKVSDEISTRGKKANEVTVGVSPKELVYTYDDGSNKRVVTRLSITPEGIRQDKVRQAVMPTGIYMSASHRFSKEDAARYGTLERTNKQDDLLEPLKIIEPRLRRLAVIVSGGIPTIHGDIGYSELIPIQNMGSGVSRLTTLFLAIFSSPKGVVIIDEIENGIHHSHLASMWKAIRHAAQMVDSQIIASSHSWECIASAHNAFKDLPSYDFKLHRLEKIKNRIELVSYDKDTLDKALDSELEVR